MTTTFELRSAVLTHAGRKRPHNEDFADYFEPNNPEDMQDSGCLYIVADGVGGAAQGERASQYATEKVLHQYYRHPDIEPGVRLKKAVRRAGDEIFAYAEQRPHPTRMATTMVAAIVRNNVLTVANIGDSRAYLIRNGKAHQITVDHTIVEEMVRQGVYTKEEARHAKGKNRLSRSLGGEPDARVDIFDDIPLRPGDKILLCSDGLTKYATDEALVQLMGREPPEEAVHRLVDFANEQGGADNISAILIEVGQLARAAAFVGPQPERQLPSEVDWDMMKTQPAPDYLPLQEDDQKTSRSRTLIASLSERLPFPFPQEYTPWLVAGVVLFCLTGIVGVWFGNQFNDSGDSYNPVAETTPSEQLQLTTSLTPEIQTTVSVETTPTVNEGENGDQSSGIPVESEEPDITPTNSLTPVIESEEPDDENGIPEIKTISEDQWCVYIVPAGVKMTLKDVVERFIQEGEPAEQFREEIYESSGGRPWQGLWGEAVWENRALP